MTVDALWLLDTSVFIPYFRQGRFEKTVASALEHETLLGWSVVWMELYVGTRDRESKRELDALRAAASAAGRLVSPTADDFFQAGVALSFHRRYRGAIETGNHLCDLLICLCAARRGAVLVTENGRHMETWRRLLLRSGLRLSLAEPA